MGLFVACSRTALARLSPRWECVCRVCVAPEFYVFYAFGALVEFVSYGNTEGLKVQVPLRHPHFTAVPSRPLKPPRVTRFSFACFSPAVVARFESRATVSFASSVCAWVTVRKACVHIASSWICLDGRATPELSEDQSDA